MSEKPQAPNKPKHRKLTNMAASTIPYPWFFSWPENTAEENADPILKDTTFIDRMMEAGKFDELYQNPEVIAVAVGELRWEDYMTFETVYGYELNEYGYLLMYVFYAMAKKASPGIDSNETPEIKVLQNPLRIETPVGTLDGSFQKNAMKLLAFILTRKGRILGMDGPNAYKLETITEDSIYKWANPNVLLDTDWDDLPVFMEIMRLAGLYSEDPATGAMPVKGQTPPEKAAGN